MRYNINATMVDDQKNSSSAVSSGFITSSLIPLHLEIDVQYQILY